MIETKRTAAGSALTDLILDLFRVNNRILAAGDRLVADLGLTSARWQVLGTIVAAHRPQPVAWLARDMGANRQNVQRIVHDLAKEGLVAFAPNPHHRRAQLIVLTDKGKEAFDAAMRLQAPWFNTLSEGLQVDDIKATHSLMTALRRKLEGNGDAKDLG
jgi:DNA-binding MarR family transcriptional regulator